MSEIEIRDFAVLRPGEPPDVSFVPPLLRRRLSPLQKVYFALARQMELKAEVRGTSSLHLPTPYVFASRDGEDTLTRRIVEDFHSDGTVSPHRFSSSVYNAAPGLWSVFTKNPAPYTAIAAGDDTIECGLLEAAHAATAGREAVFVYAEETGGGYGLALRIGSPCEGEGRGLRWRMESENSSLHLNLEPQPFSFDALVAFLKQAHDAATHPKTLIGKWTALSLSCAD